MSVEKDPEIVKIEGEGGEENVPAKVEKTEAEKALIQELQAERQRRQAAEEELERAKKVPEALEGSDPTEVFAKLMSARERDDIEQSRKEALEEFKVSVREFSPENDEAGIVFSKFERELKKFNLSDLKSKSDFKKRFKEVHEFMERGKSEPKKEVSFYSGSTPNTGSDPKEVDGNALSSVEINLIKRLNWTPERYLKQKAARPAYVAQLLQYTK